MRYLPREAALALEAILPEGASAEDPVFGLSGRQVGRRGAAAARAAGLGEGFSGHSGRVGLAADLSRAGRLEVGRHGDALHAQGDGEKGSRGEVPRGPAGPVRLIRPRQCRTKCLPSSPERLQPLDVSCYFNPRIGLTLAQSLGIDRHRSGLVALTIGDG